MSDITDQLLELISLQDSLTHHLWFNSVCHNYDLCLQIQTKRDNLRDAIIADYTNLRALLQDWRETCSELRVENMRLLEENVRLREERYFALTALLDVSISANRRVSPAYTLNRWAEDVLSAVIKTIPVTTMLRKEIE